MYRLIKDGIKDGIYQRWYQRWFEVQVAAGVLFVFIHQCTPLSAYVAAELVLWSVTTTSIPISVCCMLYALPILAAGLTDALRCRLQSKQLVLIVWNRASEPDIYMYTLLSIT